MVIPLHMERGRVVQRGPHIGLDVHHLFVIYPLGLQIQSPVMHIVEHKLVHFQMADELQVVRTCQCEIPIGDTISSNFIRLHQPCKFAQIHL